VKRITGLYDVSIVTHPAYDQTSVDTREQGDEIMKIIDRQIAGTHPAQHRNEGEKREAAKRSYQHRKRQIEINF